MYDHKLDVKSGLFQRVYSFDHSPTAALAAAVLAQKIFIFFDGFIIKPYFHNKSIENSSRSLFWLTKCVRSGLRAPEWEPRAFLYIWERERCTTHKNTQHSIRAIHNHVYLCSWMRTRAEKCSPSLFSIFLRRSLLLFEIQKWFFFSFDKRTARLLFGVCLAAAVLSLIAQPQKMRALSFARERERVIFHQRR